MRQPLRTDRSLRRQPPADNGNALHCIPVRQESSGIQNAVVYSLKLGLTVFGYAVCYSSSEVQYFKRGQYYDASSQQHES